VLQVVLWRLRYKLSLRDLAEVFLEREFVFTHEAVREWEARFAPLLAEHLRAKRQGQAGSSWYIDETSIKVNGQWCYLYRAIDRQGNLVDSMLSQTRDMDAAQRFFRQARVIAGQAPERVTTDGHTSYPRAIREMWGRQSSIAATSISTTASNKIITGSNSATILCGGSARSHQRSASAGPSRNSGTSNAIG
jgi:transposase-like protein